jgi:hypothetical protein
LPVGQIRRLESRARRRHQHVRAHRRSLMAQSGRLFGHIKPESMFRMIVRSDLPAFALYGVMPLALMMAAASGVLR